MIDRRRLSRALAPACLLIAASLLAACGGAEAPIPGPASAGPPVFTERAQETGLIFEHDNGMYGEYYLCEIMGHGGALFDYDNDGDLDVYLVQGSDLRRPTERDDLFDRLFRNLLVESGELRFEDVTSAANLRVTGYGMGAAAADYDGDGYVDLYVTNFGPNTLLHNEGDGTFRDVTQASGAAEDRWSAAATFFDYDVDGHLDLYVGNYVDFTFSNHKHCYSESSEEFYCPPAVFEPVPDRLLHNRGDGTFEDVSTVSGVTGSFGPALGVVPADFTGNGRLDIYVANDGLANNLWVGRGDGTFEDRALPAGVAYNQAGEAEASMGVDAADFDRDGDLDLFLSHFVDETNTLYVNTGNGQFDDSTTESGLGLPSRPFTSFGAGFFDYDNDGWLDLLVVNGSVTTIPELARAGDPYPFSQRNQLFRNVNGRFEVADHEGGPVMELSEISRGAAFGDIDNDGDTDVLVFNNEGPTRLLINDVGNDGDWIGFSLRDAADRRDAVDARLELILQDGSSVWSNVRSAGSYMTHSDPRLLLGLGDAETVRGARVHWPGGEIELFEELAVGSYQTLLRGSGAIQQ